MEKEIRISNNLNEIVVLASFIEELGEEQIGRASCRERV